MEKNSGIQKGSNQVGALAATIDSDSVFCKQGENMVGNLFVKVKHVVGSLELLMCLLLVDLCHDRCACMAGHHTILIKNYVFL
jgi:hypothetical protein